MAKRRTGWLYTEIGGLPVWGMIAAVVFVIAAAAFALASTASTSTPQSWTRYTPPPEAEEPPSAAFIGDSYTAAGNSYVDATAEALGWEPQNYGQGGTGYAQAGPDGIPDPRPISERVADIISSAPDVVVFAAGINDARPDVDIDTLRAAVQSSFDQVTTALPDAQVFVIGPFWPNGHPTADALRTRDVIAEEAQARGFPFIDPIERQWITGSNDGSEPGNRVEYIGEDGTHPNAAGQAYLAERITEALREVGAG